METSSDSRHIDFSSLLLNLHKERKTGVLTVKNKRLGLTLYIKNGVLVHAEGLDKEKALIQEIARRKDLEPKQIQELLELREISPHSLGQTLTQRGMISPSGWDKFLLLRAKHHLATAIQMDMGQLDFVETEPRIPPVDSVNRDLVELLLDTIRELKNQAFLKKFVPGAQSCFGRRPERGDLEAWLPLNSTEKVVLAAVDGKRTVEDISSITGLPYEVLYRIFYLFLFLGLVSLVEEPGAGKPEVECAEITNLYLDLLNILETHFRKELGQEFDKTYDACIKELTGQSKALFQGIDLLSLPHEEATNMICDRFMEGAGSTNSSLVLTTSFNKLLYLMIMRMKKILGAGITEKAIQEMLNMVEYLKKYRQDVEMLDYINGNLKDYLGQIKS